jgi:hypothetical protein
LSTESQGDGRFWTVERCWAGSLEHSAIALGL